MTTSAWRGAPRMLGVALNMINVTGINAGLGGVVARMSSKP